MDLQLAINTASAGATIQIPDNERCVGNFIVNKPLTIVGGINSTILAGAGNEFAAIEIKPGTGPVVLRKLNISVLDAVTRIGDIVRFGDGTFESGQTSLDKVPQGLWLDECDVFGRPNLESQRGVSANGANFKATKTKIREIHGKGYDTQAICAWNGPGPFLIEDCYLEAAGENVMFGGAMSIIPNVIPSDITIRRTQFFKPLAWKGVWTVKNLFELKNARRVLVEDSTFENCWIDGQDGYAWVFTVRGEGGGKNPWNTVENVKLLNCVVRNCNRGIQTLGRDNLDIAQVGHDLSISNCKFEGIADWFFVLSCFDNTSIEHVTSDAKNSTVVFTGYSGSTPIKSKNFVYRNSASTRSEYGFKADGGGSGTSAFDMFAENWSAEGNVIAGAEARSYPASNFYPADLSTLSTFKGTDGQTPGYLGASAQPSPLPQPEPLPVPTEPVKTPSPDGTKGTEIIDSQLATWTIGSSPDFSVLRDGKIVGGAGTVYKYLGGVVWILGLDNWWWRRSDTGWWERVSDIEPGVTQPQPVPEPTPTPLPQPVPSPARVLLWPSDKTAQTNLWQVQAKDGYRADRHVERPKNMPKGNYVEFVKW